MLNIFLKSTNKKLTHYRIAKIKEDSGEQISFNYYLVDREDTKVEEFLRGVEMQSSSKIIRTTFSYNFTIKTKIVINNVQYAVRSIYTEQQEIDNGLFRQPKQIKYLVLAR